LADGDAEPIEDEPLDEPAAGTDVATQRRAILERLASREVTAEEAATALRELGGA
jgi:DNA-binding transcriptional ArsR family regulator